MQKFSYPRRVNLLEEPYNPLDKRNLAETTAKALLARRVGPLPPPEPFVGAGIYAIYYTGDFPAYRRIAERNRGGRFEAPIYVGKAIPPGARKGGYGLGESPGRVLFNRLREHAESISQAQNLNLADFVCRYLVTDDIWIPLVEALLIEKFRPVWNWLIHGFCIYDPGKRRPQERSEWDTLHPGRSFAGPLPPNQRTAEDLFVFLNTQLGDS